jgi:glycosyltransferase involved in cell wall biosynthesis
VTDTPIDLSVVLPCYRAAAVALNSAARLLEAFDCWGLSGEVIIVDDGGGGFESATLRDTRLSIRRLTSNRGKGAAVREGVTASRGRIVAYTDVDLPYGVDAIAYAAQLIDRRGFHLVLGDRWLPGSSFAQPRSRLRRVLSRFSATAVGSYLTGGFSDTQCGLKILPGRVARPLFQDFVVDGFAFEVEMVHTALALGLDIKRIAVTQETDGPSSVKVFTHSAQALRDLLVIRARGRTTRQRFQALLKELSTLDQAWRASATRKD